MNIKDLDNAISIPNIEDIAVRTMTPNEVTHVDEITKDSYYRPKYRNALKIITVLDVHEYYETHPDAPAKDVLSDMIKTYNSELPSDILLDVAQIILTEWESIKASKKELATA